jgi:hypothetical protein
MGLSQPTKHPCVARKSERPGLRLGYSVVSVLATLHERKRRRRAALLPHTCRRPTPYLLLLPRATHTARRRRPSAAARCSAALSRRPLDALTGRRAAVAGRELHHPHESPGQLNDGTLVRGIVQLQCMS